MDMLAARPFRVILAAALAANCCLPCYTFAYADDMTDGGARNVSAEEQEEIAGDAGGVELSSGDGESNVDAADGGAATEGHGADDGAAEGAGEYTAEDHGEVVSFVSGDISSSGDNFSGTSFTAGRNEDTSQFGIPSSNGDSSGNEEDSRTVGEKGILDYLEDIVYLLGEIADYHRQGQGGIDPLLSSTEYNQLFTAIINIRSDISGSPGTSSASNRHQWSMPFLVDKWTTSKGGLAWITSECAWILDYIRYNVLSIKNYMMAPDANGTSYSVAFYLRYINEKIAHFRDDQRSIWGYNYSGTAVINSNSPASWLQTIRDRLYAPAHDGNSYSVGYFLRFINQRAEQIKANTDSINNYSSLIRENTNLTQSYLTALDGDGTRYSAAYFLRYINDKLASVRDHTSSIDGFTSKIRDNTNLTQSYLFAPGHDGNSYSAAYFLSYINSKVDDIRGYISTGNQLLTSLSKSLTAWGNRWDTQDRLFIDWFKRWDALEKEPADLSEINKLLGLLTADVASIRDKYVVGDTLSDMFGALVGDLQVPATAAAIDGIKGAMSTAFPFCIPSVVNLVLFGSVVADPQAPCWEFDIAGSPLVVDFSGFEDFAEVCRWTVRLLFVAALLLNTRKFVYGVGGAY